MRTISHNSVQIDQVDVFEIKSTMPSLDLISSTLDIKIPVILHKNVEQYLLRLIIHDLYAS